MPVPLPASARKMWPGRHERVRAVVEVAGVGRQHLVLRGAEADAGVGSCATVGRPDSIDTAASTPCAGSSARRWPSGARNRSRRSRPRRPGPRSSARRSPRNVASSGWIGSPPACRSASDAPTRGARRPPGRAAPRGRRCPGAAWRGCRRRRCAGGLVAGRACARRSTRSGGRRRRCGPSRRRGPAGRRSRPEDDDHRQAHEDERAPRHGRRGDGMSVPLRLFASFWSSITGGGWVIGRMAERGASRSCGSSARRRSRSVQNSGPCRGGAESRRAVASGERAGPPGAAPAGGRRRRRRAGRGRGCASVCSRCPAHVLVTGPAARCSPAADALTASGPGSSSTVRRPSAGSSARAVCAASAAGATSSASVGRAVVPATPLARRRARRPRAAVGLVTVRRRPAAARPFGRRRLVAVRRWPRPRRAPPVRRRSSSGSPPLPVVRRRQPRRSVAPSSVVAASAGRVVGGASVARLRRRRRRRIGPPAARLWPRRRPSSSAATVGRRHVGCGLVVVGLVRRRGSRPRRRPPWPSAPSPTPSLGGWIGHVVAPVVAGDVEAGLELVGCDAQDAGGRGHREALALDEHHRHPVGRGEGGEGGAQPALGARRHRAGAGVRAGPLRRSSSMQAL